MASAFDSPDKLQLKGKVKGVTRLSRRAKFGIALIAFFAAGTILFSILTMDEEPSAGVSQRVGDVEDQKDSQAPKPVAIPATPNFEHIGDGQAALAVQAATAPAQPGDAPPLSAGTAATVQGSQNLGPAYAVGAVGDVPKLTDKALPSGAAGLAVGTPALPGRGVAGQQQLAGQPNGMPPQMTQKELEAAQRKREMDERKKEAARAPLDTQIGDTGQAGAATAATAALSSLQESLSKAARQGGQQMSGIPAIGTGPGALGQQDDPNKQQRKEQFLKNGGDAGGKPYLAEGVQMPLSPYEIKAGWAIPAELQSSVNSDIPGQFVARVTENVYDSATGRHLLIPQHTIIIGTYDSQVAYGQERILAISSWLKFPDGTSLNLGGMPGADKAGSAGFDADVNNHYGKVFGSAAFMAMFSAAVSLTQKQNTTINGQQTNSQVITQQLGQQLGQTGSAFIQRGMNVQPTLSRNRGYKFNIMTTKDIVFPGPYRWKTARSN